MPCKFLHGTEIVAANLAPSRNTGMPDRMEVVETSLFVLLGQPSGLHILPQHPHHIRLVRHPEGRIIGTTTGQEIPKHGPEVFRHPLVLLAAILHL
ncbi:MAG: hypothetical protein ABSH20_10895 [Tepidisphaeraceae bacterium]